MAEYDVSRSAGQCSVSGRAFEEDEEFYSVVIETPEGFQRKDIAEECWEGPPSGAVCHFKTKLPKKEEARKTFVNDDVLVDFFLRLSDSEEPVKRRFRFVLSLILMRKRLLKYMQTFREEGCEYWEMRLARDKSLHKVLNPSLNEAEIETLASELGSILHGHAPEASIEGDFAGVGDAVDPVGGAAGESDANREADSRPAHDSTG